MARLFEAREGDESIAPFHPLSRLIAPPPVHALSQRRVFKDIVSILRHYVFTVNRGENHSGIRAGRCGMTGGAHLRFAPGARTTSELAPRAPDSMRGSDRLESAHVERLSLPAAGRFVP